TARIFSIYNSAVFEENTLVKAYRFERQLSYPPYSTSLGDDYLAKGFGLVRSDIEGGDIYYLSGAIINGQKIGVITSINEGVQSPKSFALITNYPNPFNNSTIVEYTIVNEGNVNISVYDILGRKVKDIIDEKKEKGSYKIRFNVDNLTSGIYFLMLKTNSNILTHKILLLK
ncbi:MAG: T9SS type A sorting domain-containing protein, partial [Ignavibacteriaceae bacterium]